MSWIKVGKITIDGATSASIDNCFSSQYHHYMIIGITNQRGGSSSSEHRMRLRSNGSDDTSGNYGWQRLIGTTSLSAARSVTMSSWTGLPLGGAYEGDHSMLYVSWPHDTRPTRVVARPTLDAGGSSIESWHLAMSHDLSTEYDGFTILSDADIIYGTYYIYGLKEE